MTKSDLIEVVSADLSAWRKKDVEGAINTIFTSMTNALVRGDRV